MSTSKKLTLSQVGKLGKQELMEGLHRDLSNGHLYRRVINEKMGAGGCTSMYLWVLRDATIPQQPKLQVVQKPSRPQALFPFIRFKTGRDDDVGPECQIYLDYFEAISEAVGWPDYDESPGEAKEFLGRLSGGARYGALSKDDNRHLHAVRDVAEKFYHIDNVTVEKVQRSRRERRR